MADLDWNTLTSEPTGELSWDALSITPTKPNDQGDVSRGFTRAFAQVPELAYGTGALAAMSAEKLFGEGGLSTSARKFFADKYAKSHAENQQYAPTVEWTDAWDSLGTNPSKMADWIQDSTGYVVGQALQTLATGGIGAIAGKMTLGSLVAGSAAKAADAMVAKEVAKLGLTGAAAETATAAMLPAATATAARNLSTALGSGVVLTGQNLGMEAGDIYGGLLEESKKTGKEVTGSDLVRAWTAAGLAAGTETVTDMLGLGAMTGRIKIGGKAVQEMTGVGGRAARAGIAAGVGMPLEGGQEWVQTGLEQWGAGQPLNTPEAAKERINAAAVGALGGAVVGGGAGALAPPVPTVSDIERAPDADSAIAAAEAALAAPVDALSTAIDAFRSEFEQSRVPADSALPLIGMPAATITPQAIALPTDTTPSTEPLDVPRNPAGPALLALAEQLSIMPAGEQTKALMRLDAPMRQAVVAAMQAPSIITPNSGVQPAQGQAAILTNEATLAASSVQPTGDATVTNVPALTQRAAQEIVSKTPNMEMRPHREVAGRFEVVPIQSTAGEGRAVPPTLQPPVSQQQLADQEAPPMPSAPAARPAVPPAPLTAEQQAANQAAADAERSSLPRRSIFRNSQLRSETGPDIKGEKVTRNMRRFLSQIGRLTGTKVIFEYAPEDSEGAVPIRGENVIHINTAAEINPLAVMGHEVTHVLKDRHREAWNAIRDALVATLPDKRAALEAFATDYWYAHPERIEAMSGMKDLSQKLTPEQKTFFNTGEDTIEAFLIEEMVSDLGGQHWTNEQFWIDTFAKIEKQHGSEKAKGIIQRLVSAIKQVLSSAIALVRQQKQGNYQTISAEQLEKTRDAVTSAYAKFINEERTNTPEHPVIDRRISTSDVTSRTQAGVVTPTAITTAAAADTADLDELEKARADELSRLSPQRDQRLFFEVAPKPSEAAEWNKRSDKEQRAISEDIKSRVVPGLLRDIGVTGNIQPQLGGWMDDTNPSFALVVTRGDPALAARAVGYVLDQEAVFALGLKPFTGGEKTGIIHFNIDSSDRALVHKIYTQIRVLDSTAISGHSTLDGEMYIGLSVERMNQLEQQVTKVLGKAGVATVYFDEGFGATIGEKDYGMQSGQGASPELRATARDVNRWRDEARKLRGKSDAGRGGSDRAVSRSEARPSYGKAIDRHAVSVTGVHYSGAKRTELSSEFYGSGYRGAERTRVLNAKDPRIKRRIYFYTNNGSGINPESGVGYHAHSVELNNLYDGDNDPLGLWESNPSQAEGANKFETNILDAGYDGYYTRNFGRNGAAVLLGAHTVPVAYEGLGTRPDVPARMSEPRPVPQWYRSALADEAAAVTAKSMPVSGWQGWVKGLRANGKVKPDEITWSGIEDFIAAHGDERITADAVRAYLSEFGVRVQTLLRGESNPRTYEADVQVEEDEDEREDLEPDFHWGSAETEDPDEYYLEERARERYDEEVERKIDDEWDDIADEMRGYIGHWSSFEEEEAREQLGTLFDPPRDQVIAAAESLAIKDAAQESFEYYRTDDDPDDISEQELVERAVRILSDDDLIEEEARRRVKVSIDEDDVMRYLVDQEREWYYQDSDSPFTQTITVTVGDEEYQFTYLYRWGEKEVWDDDHRQDVDLGQRSYRLDEAGIQQAIWMHLIEEIGIDTRGAAVQRDTSGFIPTKWDTWATDKHSAVAGSYREMQLLLPQGAVGGLINRKHEGVTYTIYDKNGNAQIETAIGEERAKERAEEIGGRYEKNNYPVPVTERNDAPDFYYTTHFPEANILGFFRFDERIDQDGKRVMFIQEIQSDWGSFWYKAQKAEKNLPAMRERMAEMNAAIDTARQNLKDVTADGGMRDSDLLALERKTNSLAETAPAEYHAALAELHALLDDRGVREKLQRDINDAEHDISRKPVIGPFTDATPKWTALVVKRIIAHAVEYGFDRVAWTTGAQQVERWKGGLRQQIDRIEWDKTEKGVHIVALKNGEVRQSTRYAETELTDAIGKLMSNRIFNDPNQSGVIEGNDITIDDIGMAASYDRIIPNTVNDLLRRLDKEVKVREIQVGKVRQYSVAPDPDVDGRWIVQQDGKELVSHPTKERAEANVEELIAARAATELGNQLGFDISDKIRETAERGMPLFSERRRRESQRAERKADNRRAWYYSQLSVAVGSLPAKIRTAREAAIWLQANAGKLGVKKDELKWSGVLDWLNGQGKTTVTASDIQDWLRDNGVKVKDVLLGGRNAPTKGLTGFLEFHAFNKQPSTTDEWLRESEHAEVIARQWQRNGDKKKAEQFFAVAEEMQRMAESGETGSRATRWSRADLNIPGGKDYRELLLTLPVAEPKQVENVRLLTQAEIDSNATLRAEEAKEGDWWGVLDDDGKPLNGAWKTEQDALDVWLEYHDDPHTSSRGRQFTGEKREPVKFESNHYLDVPNIIAHIRMNERTDADGKRVLFIEEIQSDWGQKGRKEGFAGDVPTLPKGLEYKAVANGMLGIFNTEENAWALLPSTYTEARAYEVLQNQRGFGRGLMATPVPSAPFVTDTQAWTALALKRAIAYAVDNGFDRIAWTTGEQQAERYDLSKQVDAIAASKNTDGTWYIQGEKNGSFVTEDAKVAESKLPGIIGKELAKKIVDETGVEEYRDGAPFRIYRGNDLKVGGEGMKGYYDAIVPQIARKLGATMRKVTFTERDPGTTIIGDAELDAEIDRIAEEAFDDEATPIRGPSERVVMQQPGFTITDEMRQQARIGMPLFSTKRRTRAVDTNSPSFRKWFGNSKVVDADGKPLRVYHATMPDRADNPDTGFSAFHDGPSYFGSADETSGADTGYGDFVYPTYISIKSPYRTSNYDELAGWRTGEFDLPSKYDGIIYDPSSDNDKSWQEWRGQYGEPIGSIYAVRSPTQIKSAISNTGEFSDTNPDIRRSEQRKSSPELEAWLGDSKVRHVMYHGTARDITTFRPKQADAIFLTDNPEFAANFADLSRGWMLNNYQTWMTPEQIVEAKQRARSALPPTGREREREMLRIDNGQNSPYLRKEIERMMPSESNIMPLYVRAENPFDYRNPEHVAAIERELGPSWMGHEFINGEMFEVAQHIGDLERGDWNAIESPQVQAYIRANHDSFYVRERGTTNLAVFSPNQVKSASGNSGAYSREDNDIRRSERRFQPSGHGQYLTELKNVARDLDSNDRRTKQYAQSRLVKVMDMPAVLRQIVDGTRGKVFRNVPQRIVGSGTTLLVKPMDQHVTSKHDGVVNPKVIFDLPKYLADPLAVFSGEGGTNPDSFRIVLRDRFDGKNPVVAIEPQAGHGFVMTIHTGSDSGLQRWIDGGLLHYVDEKAAGLRPAATDGSVGGSIPRIPNVDWSVAKERAEDKGRVVVTRDQVAGMDEARLSTLRSRITGQPINQTWTDPEVTDWDDFVRKMQDDKIDTKRVLRAIREAGVLIKEKFDAYMLETNYHGRAAARVEAFSNDELRKLLEDMAMRKLSVADLDDYLWARHAAERNAQNARSNPAITDGSGMTDTQAADILAGRLVTINGRDIQLTPAALQAAAAVASRVDAITNKTLDLLVEYGLETQQTVDTWRNTYAHYVPLKRDMESDANYSGAFGLGNGSGSGFDVRGPASKRAMGSKRAVTDILANVAMQRERAIARGEKNRVAQGVYGLALSAPNPEFWIPLNPTLNKNLSPTAIAKVVQELVALGINPIDAQNIAAEPVQRYIDPRTGLEAQRINPTLRSRDDVLSTRINGEDRYVMFSNKKRAQEMVRGLKNLDAAQVSGALQVIAPVTRWFASVNTQFNPVFGLTNGVRDFSTGMLNLSSTPLSADRGKIAAYAWDALKGIYLDLRDHRAGRAPRSQWAQLFEQFELDGGRTGYRDMFATSADRAEAIAKELKHAGKGKQWVLGGERHSAVFGWLSDYNTAVENAMRLAAYKAALDKGMSRDAAASLAKNLTVNFNKKGLAATQTGALYAFFNAAVQGTARISETVSKDGKLTTVGQKIVYGGMILGVMQAMMGVLAGWDDDEPPQFQREKNFIIPVFGTDKYVSVPMPLGFHVLPNVGRVVTEWMMSGFKDPGKRLTRLAGIIVDAFNPIGSGTFAQTLSPTIGDPIIALAENKDWTGKSIYKADFNKLHPTPGWTRTKDTASPPSKWLSYAINYVTGGGKYEIGMVSPTPDQIDYLVGQATGGVGRELLKTAQYVSTKVTGEELPIHKTPLGVGRFVGETKGQSSETSKFYRNLERIGEHKSAMDEMKHARDTRALQQYLDDNPDARLVQVADKAQREIGYLRRQKRELIESGASKERVRLIEDKITGLTKRYNEVLRPRG